MSKYLKLKYFHTWKIQWWISIKHTRMIEEIQLSYKHHQSLSCFNFKTSALAQTYRACLLLLTLATISGLTMSHSFWHCRQHLRGGVFHFSLWLMFAFADWKVGTSEESTRGRRALLISFKKLWTKKYLKIFNNGTDETIWASVSIKMQWILNATELYTWKWLKW